MKKVICCILTIILIISCVFVGCAISGSADESWKVMFDWESEGDHGTVPATAETTGKTLSTSVTVRELSQYGTDSNYNLISGSTKAIWFYNQLMTDYNPADDTPASVSLNTTVLQDATDLRAYLHIKPKTYTTENFYFGAIIDGITYYEKLDKTSYNSAAYYSFTGKTLTKVGGSGTITVTSADIPNFSALVCWVETAGYSALLLDNVEYTTDEIVGTTGTTTETTTASDDASGNIVLTMDSGSRPAKSGVVGRSDAVSYINLSDGEYNYVLQYNRVPSSGSIQDQVAYFALPSDAYSRGTPTKVTFDVKTDTGLLSLKSFKVFAGSSDTSAIKSAYEASTLTVNYSSFGSSWSTKEITVTESMITNNYLYFGFVNQYASSYLPNYLYIDNITVYYAEGSMSGEKNIQYYRDNMELEWSEEFNGESLDETVWNYQPETKHRNEQESAYKNDNVTLQNGNLIITAKKGDVVCGCDMTEEEHLEKYSHSKTYEYSAGGIDTQNKKLFSKGLIETSVKCPTGSGTWCSVWMCGVDPDDGLPHWPWTGEIDIIEYLGKSNTEEFSSLHYYPVSAGGYESGYDASKKMVAGGLRYQLPQGNFNDGFHTVGMMWTETSIDFYVDDVVVNKIDISGENFYAFRDYEFYFMVTFPLGGTSAGSIDNTVLPQNFEVDYIRSYQPYDANAEQVTSDSVTLTAREGYQYSIDGKTWQLSNVFTGLQENTEYTFYQRMSATEVFSGATNISDVVTVKTLSESGYSVTIDGEVAGAVASGEEFTLPTSSNSHAVAYTDGERYYAIGEKLTVTEDMRLTAVTLDISMKSGASIRLDLYGGIRFYTDVDIDRVIALEAAGITVEQGTLIIAKDLTETTDITHSTDSVSDVKYEAELGTFNEDGFVGSIVGIKEQNHTREYLGRGYVNVTVNGITTTVYADSSDTTVRSIAQVASFFRADTAKYNALSDTAKAMVSVWADKYEG